VLAGDHPDPSVIRVGTEFWSTNTSGERSPQFPLFRSRDLVHWLPAGAVFQEKPRWAQNSFWAPELIADRGRYLIYYAARKSDGPLCVAVATASSPQGPYLDHGPLVCQEDGSIDPAFIRDEKGSPYLIWKEDGNSIHKPTPIWAQPLSDDLVHLQGRQGSANLQRTRELGGRCSGGPLRASP
jgi:xylan 1,4-beta-xylosidase